MLSDKVLAIKVRAFFIYLVEKKDKNMSGKMNWTDKRYVPFSDTFGIERSIPPTFGVVDTKDRKYKKVEHCASYKEACDLATKMNEAQWWEIEEESSNGDYLYIWMPGIGTIGVKRENEGIVIYVYPLPVGGISVPVETMAITYEDLNELEGEADDEPDTE